MSVMKKILFVVCFVLATLVAPAVLLLFFIDSSTSFTIYVIVFGVIIFGILGYIIASLRSISKEVSDALEEMKKQNAAIAFKITQSDVVNVSADANQTPSASNQPQQPKLDTQKVNLNPADPLDFE